MISGRQDGWTKEEDALLAKIVLMNIREGSTQLQAFAEVGKVLSRTPAACGFRWNSTVRKEYNDEIITAKKQRTLSGRTKKKIDINKNTMTRNMFNSGIDLITCINYLEQLRLQLQDSSLTQHNDLDLKNIVTENKQLRNQIKMLQKEMEEYRNKIDDLSDDYNTLLSLFDRAMELTSDNNLLFE